MFDTWQRLMKDESGVTLVELAIVLMLLVIMGNMVGVSFSSVGKSELNQSCIQLQSDLRYAQRLAVIKGIKHEVLFDVVGNCYKVRYKKKGSYLTYTNVKTVNFDGKVSLDRINVNAENTIAYTPTGTTNDACTIVLYNDSYTADLTVNVGSGRIKIKKFTKRIG